MSTDAALVITLCERGGGATKDGPGEVRPRLLFGRVATATREVGEVHLMVGGGTDAMKHRSIDPTCKVYGKGGAIRARSGELLLKLRDVVAPRTGDVHVGVCDAAGAANEFRARAGVFGGGAT